MSCCRSTACPVYESRLPVLSESSHVVSTPMESELAASEQDKYELCGTRLASPTLVMLENVAEWGPSIPELIQRYKDRPWSHVCQLHSYEDARQVAGIMLHKSNSLGDGVRRKDRKLLLAMIGINNCMFSAFANLTVSVKGEFLSKLILDDQDALYVRADLHSDLSTLISNLECLAEAGYLDEAYLPKKGVALVFCGDYGGKGVNDVQVLTLLCGLRIRRPASVILLKGDYDTIQTETECSSDAKWMRNIPEVYKLFTNFYKTFPLAICIAAKPNSPLEHHQFTHISHAGFSISVDLSPLLDGPETAIALPPVPKYTARFKELSKRKSPEQFLPKSKSAFESLQKISSKDVWSTKSYSCIGLGDSESGSRTQSFRFNSRQIKQYLTIAGDISPVKALIVGHKHVFKEISVFRKDQKTLKVIATILPAGCIMGQCRNATSPQLKQGLLLKVAPKVANWSKRFLITEERYRLGATTRISEEVYPMYGSTEPPQSSKDYP